MSRRRAAGRLGPLAALALAGCSGAPKAVVYDLVERVSVAERSSSGPIVLFGTPAAEPHEAEGFFRWSGGPGDRFVWARREVEVALLFDAAQRRLAVADLMPFAGVEGQEADVLLNGQRVGHLRLNAFRQRYAVELPAEAQRAGENRVRFEFARSASARDLDPRSQDGGQLAAAFYSLLVGPAGDPALEDLLARDAPRPFAQAAQKGVPGLSLLGGTSVRYALRLPAGAELRFTPELDPAARVRGGAARFRVTLERAGGEAEVLWSTVLRPRDRPASEVRLALPGAASSVARLGLHLDGPDGERFAWGVFRAARVLGLDQRAASASEDARADGLRQKLVGANVVLVVLDAARAAQLGCYGYPRPTTPEIDRIASEGVVFEQAVTPAAFTVGAMSSLWTSQQPDQHHGETSFAARLPGDRLTLAEVAGARGVHAAGFVANAMAGKAVGFDRGFSEFHEVFAHPELGSRAEVFAPALAEWLPRQKGRRFFLYLHLREPHFPYDPPAPFDRMFGPTAALGGEARRQRGWYQAVNRGERRASAEEVDALVRLYDGNLAYADREVGALRRQLEAQGLWERSLVVVTADHGEQLLEHGFISHGPQLYEESLRVPLILRFPRAAALAGRRIRELVDLLDLAPTIADVLGARAQPAVQREFDGRSLLPVALGAPGAQATLSRSVWDRPRYALRDARFKYIRDTRSGEEELYDLAQDPRESRNLAAAEPLRAACYREELNHWLGRLRQRRAGGAEAAQLTPEQCENLRSLGYVDGCP